MAGWTRDGSSWTTRWAWIFGRDGYELRPIQGFWPGSDVGSEPGTTESPRSLSGCSEGPAEAEEDDEGQCGAPAVKPGPGRPQESLRCKGCGARCPRGQYAGRRPHAGQSGRLRCPECSTAVTCPLHQEHEQLAVTGEDRASARPPPTGNCAPSGHTCCRGDTSGPGGITCGITCGDGDSGCLAGLRDLSRQAATQVGSGFSRNYREKCITPTGRLRGHYSTTIDPGGPVWVVGKG